MYFCCNKPFCAFQVDVASLQRQFQHEPLSSSVDQCQEVLSFIRGKVPNPSSLPSTSGSSLAQSLQGDTALLEDLVAMGDGGSFLDRVIAPIFMVITFEVSAQFCPLILHLLCSKHQSYPFTLRQLIASYRWITLSSKAKRLPFVWAMMTSTRA